MLTTMTEWLRFYRTYSLNGTLNSTTRTDACNVCPTYSISALAICSIYLTNQSIIEIASLQFLVLLEGLDDRQTYQEALKRDPVFLSYILSTYYIYLNSSITNLRSISGRVTK